MTTASFDRIAGAAAYLVAVGALFYAILFVAIVEGAGRTTQELWYLALMVGGAATVPVLVALYQRLRETDSGLALTALIFGLWAAFGGVLHGAYALGQLVTPTPGASAGPEQVTHGVLRYAAAGVSLLLIGWIIQRGRQLPAGLAYLAYLGGAALVFIYIGRLFNFIEPGDYVRLLPPIVYGFVIHPAFYIWLGSILWRSGERPLLVAA